MNSFVTICIVEIYAFVIELVGCTVARLVIPVLSFGRAYVEPLGSPPGRFNWLGYRRDQSGRTEVADDVAGHIGIFIILMAVLPIVMIVRSLF